MPHLPLFHPDDSSARGTGRLGNLTKREAASLASLKVLARKQGLSLGLVRGPGEQNDVCMLRFLRAQGFEEKRALASLVSCVEWGAGLGLSGLRGHPGGAAAEGAADSVPTPLPAAEGLVCLGSGLDRLGRPLVIVRLAALTRSLVESCGKKALLRYFVWSVERVLERVAASMLATQYIIEGTAIICDANGWSLENASDSALELLQDVVSIGLFRYPERLGQLFVVNVPPAQASNFLVAARALGLGAAIEKGKLRVLPGELPKWAPELLTAFPPEHLPVEYGGTAPALPRLGTAAVAAAGVTRHPAGVALPAAGDSLANSRSVSGGGGTPGAGGIPKNKPGLGGVLNSFIWIVSGGGGSGGGAGCAGWYRGRTSYNMTGLQATALVLTMWALHRKSPMLGEATLMAVAVALLAREFVGGAVTIPSSRLHVPLLHDPRDAVAAPSSWSAAVAGGNRSGLGNAGVAAMLPKGVALAGVAAASRHHEGSHGAPAVERRLEGVSLLGADVEVVKVVGKGKSGFDRFCIRVQEVARKPSTGGDVTATARRDWVAWRRLTEFVALREALVQAGCPGAEGADRDTRMWSLPPVVPFGLLMQRLETWLRRLLRDVKSATREEVRRFLLEAPLLPTSTDGVAPAAAAAAAAGPLLGTSGRFFAHPHSPGSATAPAAAPGSPRRQTVPTVSSTPSQSLSPIMVMATGGGGVGAVHPPDDEKDFEQVAAGAGVSNGGSGEARNIAGLRLEIKSMFQDPGECHALKVPQREHNQWLRRAYRTTSATAFSASSTPSSLPFSPSLSWPPSFDSLEVSAGGGGSVAAAERGGRSPPWAEGGGADLDVAAPGGNGDGAAASPRFPATTPNAAATAGLPPSPGRQAATATAPNGTRGEAAAATATAAMYKKKETTTASPRRRETLKRFVSLVKRKRGSGKRGGAAAYTAGFRLLHVDIFQVPPGNHLHRVDHIAGWSGGKAQARVKELTAKQRRGDDFLFVVNLQLPRSFTKTTSASSVVLYWGVPAECLGGVGTGPLEPSLSIPSPQPQPQPQPKSPLRKSSSSSSVAAAAPAQFHQAAFERELLMRYIDLPFHRTDTVGSGFVSSSASLAESRSGSGQGSAAESGGCKIDGGAQGVGHGGHGVPGFSAVDEDESESGLFSNQDFRNMSLKVVTSVVEGRWTVRKAVDEGNSQVLSRKLTQRYFRGSLYMETDIEIGSSVAAESVVGVCLTEPSVLDVGFFLEGGHRVLGCVRINNLNLSVAEPLMLQDTVPHPHPSLPQVSTPPGVANPPPAATTAAVAAASAGKVSSGGRALSRSGPVVAATPAAATLAEAAEAAAAVAGQAGGDLPLGSPQFQATWEDNAESHGFKVRGPGYLSGGGKVDAGRPFGELVRADLYKLEAGVDRMDNIGSVGRAAKVVRSLRKKGRFLFIVNLQVPGNPPLSMVLYYAMPVPPGGVPEEGADGRSPGFLELFRRFVDLGPKHNSEEGDGGLSEDEDDGHGEGVGDAGGGGRLPGDDLRNLRFKLFPAILEGPWIVRKAVGSKPTLIAQKLTCRYFRTRSYFEVDVDIGSSVVAFNTVSLAIGYAKGLVVDMGFCVQGETDDELPEVMLGVVRVRRLDVHLAENLGASEDHEDDDDDAADDDDEHSHDDNSNGHGRDHHGEDADAPDEHPSPAAAAAAAAVFEGERVQEDDSAEGKWEKDDTTIAEGGGAPSSHGGSSTGGGAAAGTEALGPNRAAMGPSLFAVPEGGGSQGGGPITSPGLEGVFTDSGDLHGLRVRGSSYLRDHRKILAGPSFGTLVRADLFRIDGNRHQLFRVDHICATGRMKDRVAFLQSGPNPPFLFIVNIQMPGNRAHSVVLTWGMRMKEALAAEAAGKLSAGDGNFIRLFSRYVSLDLDGGLPVRDIRNRRLKLFPKVLEGPWVVRKAVGKPCVVGKKLTARYFRRPGYFEVDIDVGSSTLASNATHLAGGYSKNLVLDLAFALQGEAENELPERLIGSARISRPDLGRAEPLD